jgi:peptidyl-tRNA hydrolase, PTH1 family
VKLICGLGNPGPEYQRTRHNVGFWICEILSRRHNIDLSMRKFDARVGKGVIAGESTMLILPMKYMNRSGRSVAPAARFFRIEPEDLLVLHDDVDLELGRVMVKEGGGNAGHKGLRSISSELGTRDFLRVRFGVGRPENPRMEVSDFVLSRFESNQTAFIEDRLAHAADAVETVLKDGPTAAMNAFNNWTDKTGSLV